MICYLELYLTVFVFCPTKLRVLGQTLLYNPHMLQLVIDFGAYSFDFKKLAPIFFWIWSRITIYDSSCANHFFSLVQNNILKDARPKHKIKWSKPPILNSNFLHEKKTLHRRSCSVYVFQIRSFEKVIGIPFLYLEIIIIQHDRYVQLKKHVKMIIYR